MNSSPARVLIADDHALAREGIRSMLANEPDLEIVGEAADGEEALEFCRKLCPDLVLMDVRMPKIDGLAATRAIKERCPQASVLIVTTHESQEYLVEAIRAGAAGYVLKEATKGQLVGAIRRVLDGEPSLNQELAMRLLHRLLDETAKQRSADHIPAEGRVEPPLLAGSLAPREMDVLRLLARGQTTQEIARNLLVSVSTVKKHVHRVISKLGVSDRTQAAVKAVELGLPPDQEERR